MHGIGFISRHILHNAKRSNGVILWITISRELLIVKYKLYHVSLYQRKVDYSNRHALHFPCFSIVIYLYRSTFEDSLEALANIPARLLTAY